MRRLIIGAVLLSLLVMPTAANGEEALAEDEVVPLERGDRAPFTGMLFATERAIRTGFMIENLQLRLSADVEREQALCAARLQYEERRLQLEQQRREFEVDQLTTRVQDQAEELAEASVVPWYRSWGFAFGMGIVASLLLVGGSVALMVGLT